MAGIPNDKKQRLLKDKDPGEAMNQILSEEKFLLTGATAFLGFQFSIVFNQSFTKLLRANTPTTNQLSLITSLNQRWECLPWAYPWRCLLRCVSQLKAL